MKNLLYRAGRIMQVIGLASLPFAIWVGEFQHDEHRAITIFLGSILVFTIGHFTAKVAMRP